MESLRQKTEVVHSEVGSNRKENNTVKCGTDVAPWPHSPWRGEDTAFLLDSASPVGRTPVGMLEIELSCRT